MRLISHLTHEKPSKEWVIGFYILSALYPLMINAFLLLNGTQTTGIISKKNNPYVDEYLDGKQINYDDMGINLFVYSFNDKVYVGETGLYNFGELNETVEVLIDEDDPSEYLVPTFRSIYFSPSGLNTFIAIFFASIYLYVMKDV